MVENTAQANPKKHMPMSRAIFLVSLAIFMDGLKLMCAFAFIVGPALVGAGVATSSTALAGVAGATATGVSSFFGSAGFMLAGTIIGISVSLLGWLFFITFFVLSGVPLFKKSDRFLTVLVGWITSEVPFVNAFPTFSVSISRIVFSVRKDDKKALLKSDRMLGETVNIHGGAVRMGRPQSPSVTPTPVAVGNPLYF